MKPVDFKFIVNPLGYVVITGAHRGLLSCAESIKDRLLQIPDLPEGYKTAKVDEIGIGHVAVVFTGHIPEKVEKYTPGLETAGAECKIRRVKYKRIVSPPRFLFDVTNDLVSSGELKEIIVREIKNRLREVYT